MPNINKMCYFRPRSAKYQPKFGGKLARDQNDKYFAGEYEGKALLP